MKLLIIFTLCFSLSHLPEAAVTEAATKMISTQQAVEQMSRAQAESTITAQLDRQEVRDKLATFGVDAEDAKLKLASLSDQELQSMATQIEKAQYGGSVTGILVVVVLVLLIIYLAKRI